MTETGEKTIEDFHNPLTKEENEEIEKYLEQAIKQQQERNTNE